MNTKGCKKIFWEQINHLTAGVLLIPWGDDFFVSFTAEGKVIVVANDGGLCSAVQFYRVSLSGGPGTSGLQ